jgi:hypothetical protein
MMKVIFQIVLIFYFAQQTFACSIPVYQYAMMRWLPDDYQALVLYRGDLSVEQKRLLRKLENSRADATSYMNLRIQTVDLDNSPKKKVKDLVKGEVPNNLPAIALWYPGAMGQIEPIWQDRFDSTSVALLTQSPTRKELSKRLIDGETTVWIFLESGNTEKDQKAIKILKDELTNAEQQLKNSSLTMMYEQADIEVDFSFSVLTMSRTDPKEKVFLTMLKNDQSGESEVDEPVVYPVFGRGRALFAIAGVDITSNNLQDAIAFLTGPCGCQIKAMNPGVDLLIQANWDQAAMDYYGVDEPLPELTGVMPEPTNLTDETDDIALDLKDSSSSGMGLFTIAGIALGVVLLGVGGTSVWLFRKGRS